MKPKPDERISLETPQFIGGIIRYTTNGVPDMELIEREWRLLKAARKRNSGK